MKDGGTLTEEGLDRDTAVVSAARVFHGVTGNECPTDDHTLTVLWGSVVARAFTLLGDGDDDISYPVLELADMLRKAYARALEIDTIPFDKLGLKNRLAWEGVARHLFALFASDEDQLRQTEAMEALIVDKMRAKMQ